MEKILTILFPLFFSFMESAFANNEKVIYGKNNLIDFYQIEANRPRLKEWSRSVAAMVSKEILQKNEGYYLINTLRNVDEDLPFCLPMTPLEKTFSSQQKISDCTAFLIGPDIMATARHCVEDERICKENYWVFDYKLENPNQSFSLFIESNVYECDHIVSKEHPLLDYALIKLKKVPLNRKPLKTRLTSDGEISGSPNLLVMGFPLGHPLKLSLYSSLRETSHPQFFRFESDTFKGNSGSPIINVEKGMVEGILFSGENDFIYEEHCKKIKHCEKGSCSGEQAIKINQIPNLSRWVTPRGEVFGF
ncbi:serine protease [Bacteriovoracales bacterium]|nr:serine protease [Bacteriovoracales bacterium]